MPDDLRVVKILRGLPSGALAEVARRSRIRSYRTGQEIVRQSDETTEVFFILEGAVRVCVHSQKGRNVMYRELQRGDFFGEFAAIDGEPRSADVEALKPTQTSILRREEFWSLLLQHPAFAERILKHLVQGIRGLTERVFALQALDLRNRVHLELLRLAKDAGVSDNIARISPAPTEAELGGRVGAARESISRGPIAELSSAGIIERQRGVLVIKDVQALTRLVQKAFGDESLI